MKISSIFAFLILLISIISLNPWSSLPIGNTITTYLIYLTVIYIIFTLLKISKKNPFPLIIKLYLMWALVSILRGVFVAENYWEWKNWFEKSIALLLPIFTLIFVNSYILQKTLAIWIRYALPLFLFFIFFTVPSAYGFYFSPLIIFGIFYPTLKKQWKLILGFLLFFVMLSDPYEARSTFIKFFIVILIILSYYIKFLQTPKFLKLIYRILIVLPIILLYLGLTGVFNIFNFQSYVSVENDQADLSDTRSFIYEEQIASAMKNNYVFWGRTPARGFDSVFGVKDAKSVERADNTKGVKMKPERAGCEVLFLNIFNYTGIIGVIFYGAIYINASYLALKKSKNRYVKMVALYVLFRFAYGWIEDFNRFDIQSITLMMMIGICYSKQFRNMSNKEITYWLRGVLDSRYRNYNLSLFN